MSEMQFLNHIRRFFRDNPQYLPDILELAAAIYFISCKQMGAGPKSHLFRRNAARRQQYQPQPSAKHNT